jgi:O-antigen/teichoic acid export membrane protein
MRRVFRNAASILTSSVVSKASTFILYALVARHLSPFEFGQLSLALTLFYLFQVLSLAGLETLITRAVAKDRAKTNDYLINGSLIVILSSLLSFAVLLTLVWFLGYSKDTATVILLVSFGLLPSALSAICEAVFRAWERMHYITYANVPGNIIKVCLVFLLLSQGHGLYYIVLLLPLTLISVACTEWWLLYRYIARPRFTVDLHFSFSLAKAASTFFGIDAVIAIMASANIILLSKFLTEREVGLYSAAAQLLVPLQVVCQSIVISVFPLMCRKFGLGLVTLRQVTEHLGELLLAITLPSVVALFFFSDFALGLLYGKALLPASGTLRLLVWELVPSVLAITLGQVLFASLHERITLRIMAVNLLVSLTFGVILISQFGLPGAAITALLTRGVDVAQHLESTSRVLSGFALGRLVWKPVVASTCMAAYLAVGSAEAPLLAGLTSGIVYLSVLLALVIWSSGGYQGLKGRIAEWYVGRV